jgi:transcriptional regulator with XRE-family HTH domain
MTSDVLSRIEQTTGLTQERLAALLGVSRQALHRWRRGGPIRDVHQRRLLVVWEILERATLRYPTRDKLKAWLDTPRGADGRTPAQHLEAGAFDRARYCAVASLPWELNSNIKPVESWERFLYAGCPPGDDAELAVLAGQEGEA